MASAFSNQIQNRNFLSPIGFKFVLTKYPKVSFFCNSARIPEIIMGTAIQPSYLKDIDVPGDKVVYEDFNLRFLVDENLENYITIHNWITGLGYPETTQQFKNLVTDGDNNRDLKQQYSDGHLSILNSNYNPTAKVVFKDLFPVSLSSLEFDSTLSSIEYFTANVNFKYTIYNILDLTKNTL